MLQSCLILWDLVCNFLLIPSNIFLNEVLYILPLEFWFIYFKKSSTSFFTLHPEYIHRFAVALSRTLSANSLFWHFDTLLINWFPLYPQLSHELWTIFSVSVCLVIFIIPMDSSPPGSSVHKILQVRILEWVAISFS